MGNIILAKPQAYWSKANQDLAGILDYVLACGLALETSVFFLMQAFWSYISKSITKSSFMSSLEFRINILASCGVIVTFPLVQYLFRNDHAYRESAPQLAFALALLTIAVLGVRTHFRFKSLLKVAVLTMNESSINVAERLEYFKDMNAILTFAFFGAGLSLGIASGDGIVTQTIARHKFASDFLVTNLNFFEFLLWVTVVLIFYPRRSIIGNSFAYSSGGATSKSGAISMQRTQNNQVSNHGGNIAYPAVGTRSNNQLGSKPHDNVYEMQAPSQGSQQQQSSPYKSAASASNSNGYYNGYSQTASGAPNNSTVLSDPNMTRGDSTDSSGHHYYYTDKLPLTKNAQKVDMEIYNDAPPTYRTGSPAPTSVHYPTNNTAVGGPSFGSSTPRIKTAQARAVNGGGSISGGGAWPTSPTSPGSPSSPVSPHATVMVGQQAFVLDEVPGAGYSRAKAAMQQYQPPSGGAGGYDQRMTSSGTPSRPRKEPRAAPGS
ncbi:hypothetical protein DFQ27_004633 [Actinomortierella ambigua]|uniref:Uncharacterized protein n=1 Tax=Actinomortierella ambigua TaxID=1343610 RepID=A0A9P6Q188_9FUNG|nr:hypothetical protein DFQ27_004633 [Actinomortierella ambigua]